MHVLWISDSPETPSGFGNVTRFVCAGLAQLGHKVSILGWQTQSAHEFQGCRVYPGMGGHLGSDSLFPFLVRHRPEMVIALGDVWWLPYFSSPHLRRLMEMTDTPWALYFPIDGDMPGERLPASWVELLREVDLPIAMSRYGQRIATQSGIRCLYIPHGVDLGLFCPPVDREKAKDRIGARGKFVVLSDSRNQPRKMLPRLLDIYARFSRECPDAVLHLHTDPNDEFTGSGIYSYDVRADVRHLDLETKVRFTPGMLMKNGGGISLAALAGYYQAADIHLLASSGEGFGLPTLQAAAAGAVPMAGGYSASLELVEGHGESIAISEWSENEFGIRRGFIDVDDAVTKLCLYYYDRELVARRSAKSREFARGFGWNEIIEKWDTLLRSTATQPRRIKHATTTTPENRAMQLVPALRKFPQGVSVRVKMVEHEFGKLEASILADARGQFSDVRIPTVPRPSVIAKVKVVRRPGYVAMAPADDVIFQQLRQIFPVLTAWIPVRYPVLDRDVETDPSKTGAFRVVSLHEARLDLAQSVLVLNLSGTMPDAILYDAAILSVPCVGVECEPQRLLWPELVVRDQEQALSVARAVLTNASLANRAARSAREVYLGANVVDEQELAASLHAIYKARELSVQSQRATAAASV